MCVKSLHVHTPTCLWYNIWHLFNTAFKYSSRNTVPFSFDLIEICYIQWSTLKWRHQVLLLNVGKYEACYLYILWVACSLVFGKTNKITYCEWLRTELHYQSSAWLCTNSVGHSGHFAVYEYFRQEESLKASWWINTGKWDFFLFYSCLSKYYCHYCSVVEVYFFKQKGVAQRNIAHSLYHQLIWK